jgi:hypothetical protein
MCEKETISAINKGREDVSVWCAETVSAQLYETVCAHLPARIVSFVRSTLGHHLLGNLSRCTAGALRGESHLQGQQSARPFCSGRRTVSALRRLWLDPEATEAYLALDDASQNFFARNWTDHYRKVRWSSASSWNWLVRTTQRTTSPSYGRWTDPWSSSGGGRSTVSLRPALLTGVAGGSSLRTSRTG